ncbi:MAG: CvpA family protein, partial [Alphaproteobacteria bacterium]|nr:CvpA family protein [Alphaproteobacteria bacterium]
MTGLDIVTLLLVSIAGALGYGRGFVRETLSLLAWVVAIVATKMFESSATTLLAPRVGTTSGAAVLAFVLIFGVTYFVGKALAKNIGARTQQSVIGPVDKLLGAA